jgi:hypothetical protein
MFDYFCVVIIPKTQNAMRIPLEAIRIINRYFGIENRSDLSNQYTEGYVLRELRARKSELQAVHAEAILAGSFNRKAIALIQLLASDRGIDAGAIDGYWGPQTQFAYDALLFYETHGVLPDALRDEPPLDVNPNNWPIERQAELEAFYGQPGDESNLTYIDVPYAHRLSWDLRQKVSRIRCHHKVADSLQKVLTEVLHHYGFEKIQELHLDRFGGCFNHRRKRGGTSWSTHSWGIALDYDPNRNQLNWGRDRAVFAGPDYSVWWKIWEAEGWVSLGRAANFDWMHIQAAKLP